MSVPVNSHAPAREIVPLICSAQHYAWGKQAETSVVARVLAQSTRRAIDSSKRYAELWMGTHRTAPSLARIDNDTLIPLSQLINGELPFLFKILSVDTALSIQAHPDKALARRLHEENGKEYRDDNHKPEMATALTEFEAMCGFRPAEEIAEFLSSVSELRSVCGVLPVTAFVAAAATGVGVKSALKAVFGALMNADPSAVKSAIASLVARIGTQHLSAKPTHTDPTAPAVPLDVFELVHRLNQQYPDDVGVLCPFFLNAVRVHPGHTLFLAANVPHAYISGDIIECMAQSDNVVRAGLTPKFRDVAHLVDMLTYETAHVHFLPAQSLNAHTSEFTPPVPEFSLIVKQLSGGQSSVYLPLSAPAILLVFSGTVALSVTICGSDDRTLDVETGMILYIPPEAVITVKNTGADTAVLYKCQENLTAIRERNTKL